MTTGTGRYEIRAIGPDNDSSYPECWGAENAGGPRGPVIGRAATVAEARALAAADGRPASVFRGQLEVCWFLAGGVRPRRAAE